MNSNTTTTTAYFCPECGSPSVTYGTLAGSQASCAACSWVGSVEGLLAHVFSHEHGTPDDVTQAFVNDVRRMYALTAVDLGRLLLKWGFIGSADPKLLGRYIAAMAIASVTALLETRAALEKERLRGN